jgi:pyruvate dehydrogenase (quinone)
MAHNLPSSVMSALAAVVTRQELPMPLAVPAEMAKGFTLFLVKAVMSGRADELIDLASTNLRR